LKPARQPGADRRLGSQPCPHPRQPRPGEADRARPECDSQRRPPGGHRRRPARAVAEPGRTRRWPHRAHRRARHPPPGAGPRSGTRQPDRPVRRPAPRRVADPGRRLAQIVTKTTTRKAESHPSVGAVLSSRIGPARAAKDPGPRPRPFSWPCATPAGPGPAGRRPQRVPADRRRRRQGHRHQRQHVPRSSRGATV
jgi:hypothetical protein